VSDLRVHRARFAEHQIPRVPPQRKPQGQSVGLREETLHEFERHAPRVFVVQERFENILWALLQPRGFPAPCRWLEFHPYSMIMITRFQKRILTQIDILSYIFTQRISMTRVQ